VAVRAEDVVDHLDQRGLAGLADAGDDVELAGPQVDLTHALAVAVVEDDRLDLHQTLSPHSSRTSAVSPV
jgi:hypothetical protein